MKVLHFFLLLWVIFALLDPDPNSESGSTDPIESGSNPDPDPQPWMQCTTRQGRKTTRRYLHAVEDVHAVECGLLLVQNGPEVGGPVPHLIVVVHLAPDKKRLYVRQLGQDAEHQQKKQSYDPDPYWSILSRGSGGTMNPHTFCIAGSTSRSALFNSWKIISFKNICCIKKAI